MIKERFLKPFASIEGRIQASSILIPPNVILSFLQSASDEELTKISYSIFVLFPDEIRTFKDKKFVEDYVKTYKLPPKRDLVYKIKAGRLVDMLRKNNQLTAKQFLRET
ncbi:hypothetical protein [Streptococcus sp. sy010]|uniref:hypothetical protein n=1 Tax=Streptococcus sp. sy010 TaxID=2600148 RepID=UPI0011B52A42|nr:hypothetical protein [Streptococcus sp. sy010]TWT16449.1 hypothetical protein FRX51_00610 [Streptococcus sp. sy010]